MIELSFENIIAFCAAVATVAGAINWIMKGVERLKKPNAEQNKRLDEVEKKLAIDNNLLKTFDKRMSSVESTNILTMEAVLALLENITDGGNTDAIKEAKEHIQKYLIGKQKWI